MKQTRTESSKHLYLLVSKSIGIKKKMYKECNHYVIQNVLNPSTYTLDHQPQTLDLCLTTEGLIDRILGCLKTKIEYDSDYFPIAIYLDIAIDDTPKKEGLL